MKKFLCFFLLLVNPLMLQSRTIIYDSPKCNVHKLFSERNSIYIISFPHFFNDTLLIPIDCEIRFCGGKLSGPILFKKTHLSGKVNLRGSKISGTISNKKFDASWICSIDGVTDDAITINEIISVCNYVFFPRGKYLLNSTFDPKETVDRSLYKAIQAHIGIHKNMVILKGEKGTEFITSSNMSTICVYTKPYQIDNSVHDITIENIKFSVINDGVSFHQWMHTIKLIGVNRAIIKKCWFNDFHGDAICLDHYGDNPSTGERSRNQNVTILNNIIMGGIHHNNRNGISVINGKNVLIKGNTIKNTSRRDMPGGIDIEPNNSAYTIENIIVKNNYLSGIRGNGGAISVISYNGGPFHKVSIVSNIIDDSNKGLLIYITTNNTSGNLIIQNNLVKRNTLPYLFKGKGSSSNWMIKGNVFEQSTSNIIPGKIKVRNLIVKGNNSKR